MKSLLFSLCVILTLQCVTSQISMEESGPGIVKPSETLDMTCKVTGASLTDSTNMYCVEWVRQPEGKGLEWLGRICYDDGKAYAQSLQGRLTLTRDTNKGEVYLKLTGVKPEESGKYYCARRYYWGYFDIWGPGTMVTITSESVKQPSVFPLIACTSLTSDMISIGCLATGYVPRPVKIQWNSGTLTTASKEMTIQYSDGFSSISFLTIPQSSLKKETFTCTVEHEPSNFKTSKEVTVKERSQDKTDLAKPSGIYVFCPHRREIEEVKSNSQLSLVCMIKSSSKDDVSVSWSQGRHPITGNIEYTAKELQTNVIFSILIIRKEHWESNKTYICKSSKGSEDEVNMEKCKG